MFKYCRPRDNLAASSDLAMNTLMKNIPYQWKMTIKYVGKSNVNKNFGEQTFPPQHAHGNFPSIERMLAGNVDELLKFSPPTFHLTSILTSLSPKDLTSHTIV